MSQDQLRSESTTTSVKEHEKKRRLPVYILAIVGIFLVAVIVYMTANNKPDASDAPPDHPDPNAQPATANNSVPSGHQQ